MNRFRKNQPSLPEDKPSVGSASLAAGINWANKNSPQSVERFSESFPPMDDVLQAVILNHKARMKDKYEILFQEMKQQKSKPILYKTDTQLCVVDGESVGVKDEHEILQMEKTPRAQVIQDIKINCNDIFVPFEEPGYNERKDKEIKTVLTKGIAGIGKTVSVQMFVLDWIKGKANQDVDFIFVLPFRELNLIRYEYSLHRLLLDFYPELECLQTEKYDVCKILFIFDGLDESRVPLNFSGNEKVSDMTVSSSLNVLMTNLIKGELLSSALIWITSRPSAVKEIPFQYITRMTAIKGFNDIHTEDYFRKKISNQHQANKIISHITTVKSLHIMCHIPVFCWISASVLQKIFEQDDDVEVPRTLTEMYLHFLLIQINTKNQKYDGNDERDPQKLLQSNKEVLLRLAKLAFRQLMEGNILFYDEDLRECGIEVTEASVYSEICSEIFKEEPVLHQRKVYSFIHLSFQEFLAALHVFCCYVISKTEAPPFFDFLHSLLKAAVDRALETTGGRLDLFLRFLLGISLESSQKLLQDLLIQTGEVFAASIEKTAEYIKDKIKDDQLVPDKSINLFLCLLEMKDRTLCAEIYECLKSDTSSEKTFSAAQCSVITHMLQMSEEILDEFDLKKYNITEEGQRRLVPAVRHCRKALLAYCNLTYQSLETVASALQLPDSPLKELDLSNTDLKDSGVKLLSAGLGSAHCKLEILRLSGCLVTKEGCSYLASALYSNPAHLRELDLSYNHPGESGEKMLSALQKDSDFTLETLNVDFSGQLKITPGLRKYACKLTLDSNTANTCLSLSEENRKVTCMKAKSSYPDNPERFDVRPQVLCKESLSGRCYWEVEWNGVVDAAVSYHGIGRKGNGNDSCFGHNEKSWRMYCGDSRFSVWHDMKSIDIKAPPSCSNKIAVYVDCPAGTLSFYSVSSDTHALTHLYSFNSRFSEPLYAGFTVYTGSVSLSDTIG